MAISPEGAFAALAPDLDSSLTVTGLAPGDAGASPQVVTGLTDRTGLRWTDAATLEVTVAKPTEVEVHDGGGVRALLAAARGVGRRARHAARATADHGRRPGRSRPPTTPRRPRGPARKRCATRRGRRAAARAGPGPVVPAPDNAGAAAVADGDVCS